MKSLIVTAFVMVVLSENATSQGVPAITPEMNATETRLMTGIVRASQSAASPAQHVSMIGTDYAFQVPAHIKAGPTAFSFENRGTVRHEMSIVLLREGVRADSILKAMAGGLRRRDFTEGQAALIIGAPIDASGPEILINLKKGRTYLILCTLKNTPESPPHVTLGMFSSFTAE